MNEQLDSNEFYQELFACRMLVFIEQSPQSNKYLQIRLNRDQFKAVSMAVQAAGQPVKDTREDCSMVGLIKDVERVDPATGNVVVRGNGGKRILRKNMYEFI